MLNFSYGSFIAGKSVVCKRYRQVFNALVAEHTRAPRSASPLDDQAHQARQNSVSLGDLVNTNDAFQNPMDDGRQLIYVAKLRNETMRSSLKERKT